jgi:hypothetical protein
MKKSRWRGRAPPVSLASGGRPNLRGGGGSADFPSILAVTCQWLDAERENPLGPDFPTATYLAGRPWPSAGSATARAVPSAKLTGRGAAWKARAARPGSQAEMSSRPNGTSVRCS